MAEGLSVGLEKVVTAAQQILAEGGWPTPRTLAEKSGLKEGYVYAKLAELPPGEHRIEQLVLLIMRRLVDIKVPIPDTGSLAADLDGLAMGILRTFMQPEIFRLMQSVVAAPARLPEAAEALHDFYARRNDDAAVIVDRAVTRGELPPSTDRLAVIRAIGAPFYYRMYHTREPLDATVAHQAAAAAHLAATSGIFTLEREAFMQQDVEFRTRRGVKLRGWLYLPAGGEPPWPAIAMTHGLGANKELYTDTYAEEFAARGIAVLLYDHPTFGDSEGEPRHEVDPLWQAEALEDAVEYLRSRSEVDNTRIGLWGTSLSGGLVLTVAARNWDSRVRAVVAQAPLTSGGRGLEQLLTPEIKAMASAAISAERDARYAGEPPKMIPLVGPDPADPAAEQNQFSALPDEESRAWYQMVRETEPRRLVTAPTHVTLLSTAHVAGFEPGATVDRITCPTLFVVAEDDQLTHTELAVEAYERIRAPKRLHLVPGGHFTVYQPETISELAGVEADFLLEHLTRQP